MESELVRLSTYSGFPVTESRFYPSRLSRLGFHYDVVADSVICHRCCFSVQLPSVVDHLDLERRHHQQSPTCRQTPPPPPETRDRLASRGQLTDDVVARGPHMTTSHGSSDAGESSHWGDPIGISPRSLASEN